MPDRPAHPPAGLYDQIITVALREMLERARAGQWTIAQGDLDVADSHARLARHVAAELERALRDVPSDNRLAAQVALCNQLLAALHSLHRHAASPESRVAEPVALLRAVTRAPQPPPHPSTALSVTTLLTRAAHEPRLAAELPLEIESADAVDLLMSFIKWSGWRVVAPAFARFARDGKRLRVLTTVYMGATDAHALDAIARLPGAEVRVSYDTRRTRLHAKAWLFRRETGFSTAYIGSSNLSAAAMDDGLEWNLRASEVDAPHILSRFRGTFETLWNEGEFERYHPDSAECAGRLASALQRERGEPGGLREIHFDLRAFPFQEQILERLRFERETLGRWHNLVVAATGTGKTMLAAFDYQRQIGADGVRPRLLFVAHRYELLEQALRTFRAVLRDGDFGELLADGRMPARDEHVFATIQSLARGEMLERRPPEHWQIVVVDEFHHAAAPTYRRLLEHVRPRVLLGLTATPERADGVDVLHWFGGHVSAELRLWDALSQQLLVPFEYYGIADIVSLESVRWSRRGYDAAVLNGLYTGNDARAALVLQKVSDVLGRPERARILGFCASVEHAEFMARKFSEKGLPALAVHGASRDDVRREAIGRLRAARGAEGAVVALFTVDLFNEGVDIPEADTVLLLRPTESATVFLQQIGRGLRLAVGKQRAVILDFIGQARREFRFDTRLSRLAGVGRGQLEREIQQGFPTLPSGCHMQLERQAREYVLENLRQSLRGRRQALLGELRATSGDPTLSRFLDESGYTPEDVYAAGGWTVLRRAAGKLPGETPAGEAEFSKRLERLLHTDDLDRLALYERLAGERAPDAAMLDEAARRRVLMAWFRLRARDQRVDTIAETLSWLRRFPAVRSELRELCVALRERMTSAPSPGVDSGLPAEWPLAVHARYERDEVLVALGRWTLAQQPPSREGILWLPEAYGGVDVLFVTLDKSGKTFSPTTSYEDYAVSPTLFHWQSQSTTGERSETGRRYAEHEKRGSRVLLFVREQPKEPFVFLGPVNYIEHEGSRPMSVRWKLHVPIRSRDLDRYRTLLAG